MHSVQYFVLYWSTFSPMKTHVINNTATTLIKGSRAKVYSALQKVNLIHTVVMMVTVRAKKDTFNNN